VDRNNFCADDSGNISLSATGGSGTTLRWLTGSCAGTSIGTGNPLVIASPTATTTYYARWENTCGNSTCATVQVSVIQPPTPATVGGPQVIFKYETTSGLGGNTPTVGTGAWSVVSGGTGTFNPNNTTPNATFTHSSGAGPIVLRWTISNPPCTASSADVTITLTVASDLNKDGDVDQDDLVLFEGCRSGPEIPRGGSDTCQRSDLDNDGDVDQSDYGTLQRCYSGENVPPDLNCANP
jgi:hypothetical protein